MSQIRADNWVSDEMADSRSGEQALDRFLQALKVNGLRKVFSKTCLSGLVHVLFVAETAECNPGQTFVETYFAH